MCGQVGSLHLMRMLGKHERGEMYLAGFRAGIIAALFMSMITAIARIMGATRMNLEGLLGSFFLDPTEPGTWLLGFVWHVLNGGFFGLAYVLLFNLFDRSSASLGAGLGVVHWLAAGLFLGFLPAFHPRIPEIISAPGYFALGMGPFNMAALLILHVCYGAIVGSVYNQSLTNDTLALKDDATYSKVS